MYHLKTTSNSRRKNKLQLLSDNAPTIQKLPTLITSVSEEKKQSLTPIQNNKSVPKITKPDSFDTIKPRFTKMGPSHQAKIPELILNRTKNNYPKVEKTKWVPDKVEHSELKTFFSRLKTILGCSFINQEKGIKVLQEKNFDVNATIDMIKEDESNYSNFFKIKKNERRRKKIPFYDERITENLHAYDQASLK